MNREPVWRGFEPVGRFTNRTTFQRTEPQAIRPEPNRTALSRTALEPNRTAFERGSNLFEPEILPLRLLCANSSFVSPDDIPTLLKYLSAPGKRFKKVQRGFKRFSREVQRGSGDSRGSNRTGLANPNSFFLKKPPRRFGGSIRTSRHRRPL